MDVGTKAGWEGRRKGLLPAWEVRAFLAMACHCPQLGWMTSHRERVTKSMYCNQRAFGYLSGGRAKLDNMSHLCKEMRSPLE